MGLKHLNAAAVLAFTTGAGVVIGTNVDISTIIIGSVATTVNIFGGTAGTTKMLEITTSLDVYPPLAINGPVTMTSSGGSATIGFTPR